MTTTALALTPCCIAFAVDGDTLREGDRRIRLLGIDAPELSQVCLDADRRRYLCGKLARDALTVMLATGAVTCRTESRDRYSRELAVCVTSDGLDLGRELVKQGWAVPYHAAPRYQAEADAARQGHRGMWSGTFIPPKAWRNGVR